jgi:putative endonuclease
VKDVFSAPFTVINEAIKFEKQIKGWTRKKKEALIKGDFKELVRLAKSSSATCHGSTSSP